MAEPRCGTPDALLDAAEQLFSERGYAAVGIREISERAGANVAAINYHFGSKSGLYLATLRRVMQGPQALATWGLLGETGVDRRGAAVLLTRFVHRFLVRLLVADPPDCCANLMLREALEGSEATDAVVRDFVAPHEALLVGVIRVLRPDDGPAELAAAARSVLGQVLHYRVFRTFLERMTPGGPRGAVAVRELGDHIARFSLRGLGCDDGLIEAALAGAGELERGEMVDAGKVEASKSRRRERVR